MNSFKQLALLAILAIGAYVVMSAVYTVSEVEQVIITQFGKPVGEPRDDRRSQDQDAVYSGS